jgi:hypothetical protein
MHETEDVLRLLQYLAGVGGSGYAASAIFAWLRSVNERPDVLSWNRAGKLRRVGYYLLYAPRYSRLTVFGLATATAIIASLLLTATGQSNDPVGMTIASIVASQVVHGFELSGKVDPFDREKKRA